MKKIFFLLIFSIITSAVWGATTVTFTAGTDVAASTSNKTITKNGVTITTTAGFLSSTSKYAISVNGVFSICTNNGEKIKSIVLTSTSDDRGYDNTNFTPSSGTISFKNNSTYWSWEWTGEEESVELTNLGANVAWLASVAVTIESGSVTPSKTTPTISFGASSFCVNLNGTGTHAATVLDGTTPLSGTTYSSSNTDVATVNASTGEVTGMALGSATITASYPGDETHEAVSDSYQLWVVDPAYDNYSLVTQLSQLSVGDKIIITDYNYTAAMGSQAALYFEPATKGVIFSDEKNIVKIASGSDVQVITLERGAANDEWALKTNNGYLCAKSSSGAQLTTEDVFDSDASADLSISETAAITFMGGATFKNLKYDPSHQQFSCFNNISGYSLLYIYRQISEAQNTTCTLAELVENGSAGGCYSVSDLTAAYYNDGVLYCKDNNGAVQQTIVEGQIDYMWDYVRLQSSYDQSNWIAVTLPSGTDGSSLVGNTLNDVKGSLTDAINFTFATSETPTVKEDASINKNTYIVANFGGTQTVGEQTYFFVKPQIMEVATIKWAQWDATNNRFIVPTGNAAGLTVGEVALASGCDETFKDGNTYEITGLIRKAITGSTQAKKKVVASGASYELLPFEIADKTTTAVSNVASTKSILSVRYYNLMGAESPTPFTGVNLQVTTYSDGSSRTNKLIR